MSTTKSPEELKEGDVVTLKCGHTKMVVHKIENGNAHCVWLYNHSEKKAETFPLVALSKYSPIGD